MDVDLLASDLHAALLVVDQQIDFEPGGALAVPGGDEILQPISDLMKKFKTVVLTQDFHPFGHISFASSYERKKPFDLLTLKEVEEGSVRSHFSNDALLNYLKKVPGHFQVLWPDHCVQGSQGAKIDPRLPVDRVAYVLKKGCRKECDSYSAFFENDRTSTGLAEYFRERKIERILIVGLAGDYCVYWSAMDAIQEGFEVFYSEAWTRFVNFPPGSKEKAIYHLKEMGAGIL
jgi:nicotinamidase/pyrazinamidase